MEKTETKPSPAQPLLPWLGLVITVLMVIVVIGG